MTGEWNRALEQLGFDPSTGMLSAALTCRTCGVTLNADGNHPAELYAGTYTGLCYRCEKTEPFVLETLADGARHWSYPPECPSFRRDRDTFWAYPDCEECGGSGYNMAHPTGGLGHSYRSYCVQCTARVSIHERRATRKLLVAVADRLEAEEIPNAGDAFAVVKAAVGGIVEEVLAVMLEVPHPIYRPVTSALTAAAGRLPKRPPKRPDAFRQAVVLALRTEAAEGRYTHGVAGSERKEGSA